MTGRLNRYDPAPSTRDETEPAVRSLGKPQATLFSVFSSAFVAILVGEVLSVIALIPPLSRWTHFDSEFSGLVLIGMPIFAGGCGALAGLLLGLLYPSKSCQMISAIIGCLPAALYLSRLQNLLRPLSSTDFEAGIMVISTICAVVLTHRTLASIESRRRKRDKADTHRATRSESFVSAIVTVIACTSVSLDLWFWNHINKGGLLGSEFVLVIATTMAVLTVALSGYLWAAFPNRRSVAIICVTVPLVTYAGVVAAWYLKLIG